MFYAIDATSPKKVLRDAVAVLQLIHAHLDRPSPPWLVELAEASVSDSPIEMHVRFHEDR